MKRLLFFAVVCLLHGHTNAMMTSLEKGLIEALIAKYSTSDAEKFGISAVNLWLNNPQLNVNAKDEQGNTLLMYTCQSPENAVTKHVFDQLLAKGALIDEANNTGLTALMMAIQQGNLTFVQKLLNKNANINAQDSSGWTPLMIAAQADTPQSEGIFNLLIQKPSINIDAQNNQKITALIIATNNSKLAFVKKLIEKKANLDLAGDTGYTALLVACSNNNLEIASTLIEAGADVTKANHNGYTPLHIAAEMNNEALVDLLLQHKAHVNAANTDGMTPLMSAIWFSQAENLPIVKKLIAAGANLNLQTTQALRDNQGKELVPQGMTALMFALVHGYEDIAEELIKAGSILSSKNAWNGTALDIAVQLKRENIRKLIIQTNQLFKDIDKDLFNFAIEAIEHGVGVNARNEEGKTPLMLAAQKNSESLVTTLIEHGADVTLQDNTGTTALDYATANNNERIISLITQKLPTAKPKPVVTPPQPIASGDNVALMKSLDILQQRLKVLSKALS